VQRPQALTTFGQSNGNNNIYPETRNLTPAIDGQCFPAANVKALWLFQLIMYLTA